MPPFYNTRSHFWFWHFSDMALELGDVRYWMDCVAKVVLQEVSKILRAAGAFFV